MRNAEGFCVHFCAIKILLFSPDTHIFAEVKLHTGRTHQIRVQMAAINCPLYGDMRYGGENAVKGRLALWAYSLRFTHPTTGEKLRFEIEPPKNEKPWNVFKIKV